MGNAPSSKDGGGHPPDGTNRDKNQLQHNNLQPGVGRSGNGGGGAPYYGAPNNGAGQASPGGIPQHYGGYPPVGLSPPHGNVVGPSTANTTSISSPKEGSRQSRAAQHSSDVSMDNPPSSIQTNNMQSMHQQPGNYNTSAGHMAQQAKEAGAVNLDGSNDATPLNLNSIEILSLDDDTVPTVFRWEHGGRQVYITGTFNGWSRQIPMHRSGNDFTYIHNLNRGKHAFKFIVDDEWRFAPDQPTVADIDGRINNFIDVSDFRAYTGDRHFEERTESYSGVPSTPSSGNTNNNNASSQNSSSNQGTPSSVNDNNNNNSKNQVNNNSKDVIHGSNSNNNNNTNDANNSNTGPKQQDDEGFSNTMPDLDEYTKEPPPLPPHLRHIILNKPPQLSDTAALPVPQHVALNHLYCTAIKDNMMVLGITQRYKTKFVTTVYYSPCDG